jgi:hypothetical protein
MAGIGWAPLGGEWWTWRWCWNYCPAVQGLGIECFEAAGASLLTHLLRVP